MQRQEERVSKPLGWFLRNALAIYLMHLMLCASPKALPTCCMLKVLKRTAVQIKNNSWEAARIWEMSSNPCFLWNQDPSLKCAYDQPGKSDRSRVQHSFRSFLRLRKHIHKSIQQLAPRKGQQERYRDNNAKFLAEVVWADAVSAEMLKGSRAVLSIFEHPRWWHEKASVSSRPLQCHG